MTEALLVPTMFVAALVIFWAAVAAVWLLGRRRSARKEHTDR